MSVAGGLSSLLTRRSTVLVCRCFASKTASSVLKRKDAARLVASSKPRSHDVSEAPLLEAVAYCISDRCDLSLAKRSLRQDYSLCDVPDVTDALAVDLKEKNGRAFVFDVGAVVFWNVDQDGRRSLLQQLCCDGAAAARRAKLDETLEEAESESLDYRVDADCRKSRIGTKGDAVLTSDQSPLDMYAISHALSLSVKLGTYESNLASFADAVQCVPEAMAAGQQLKLTRTQVFQRIGQLFKLRHDINLGVELLDVPDFYWDREDLEVLFRNTCRCLSMRVRTQLMNERLNHCQELMMVLVGHLDQEHSNKLEWYIIWLIAVEVLFGIVHLIDRFCLSNGSPTLYH